MTPDDQVHANDVDRYWDAWVLNGRPLETNELDPETQRLIDHLWMVGASPQAAAARKRVWKRLRHELEREKHSMDTITLTPVPNAPHWNPGHPNGRGILSPAPYPMRPWWRSLNGLAATAALIVLMLTAGLFVVGPLRPAGVATEPAGGPASILAPATPDPTEAVRQELVESTVPAADLPAGEDRFLHISQTTIQPGVTVTIPAEQAACCPGPAIDHVLAGELTLRVDGPLQVARSGAAPALGSVEDIAPGTMVMLQAGDSALYDQALAIEYVNTGDEPVQLVSGGLFLGRPQVSPPGLALNNFDSLAPLPPLPDGPVTFLLERVTLAPEVTLASPPPGAMRVLTSGPRIAYLPKAADGSVTNLTRDPIESYVLTLFPAGSESGAPAATPAP
jgi:hypothetical protein